MEAMRRLVFPLLLAGFTLSACNNVLPPELESRIRGKLAASRERERMLNEVAVFETDKGKFTVRFFGAETPASVGYVRGLIDEEFYDGIRIHRSVREPVPFLIQLGDPVTRGKPGEDFVWDDDSTELPVAGYASAPQTIAFEASKRKNVRGAVGIARRPTKKDGGSQLYILLSDQKQLDGEYAVVGEIAEGMDVVDQLVRGDRIVKVRLVESPLATVPPAE